MEVGKVDVLFESVEKVDEDKDVIIKMENIQKTYLLGLEGVPALRGVNLKVKKGEWIIFYGKSGSGKTTMLNIIGTIDRPTKGNLIIDGIKIGSKTKDTMLAEVRLKKMGFVFQSFNLLSTMNAVENVEIPMLLRGDLNTKTRRNRARKLLHQVGMGDRLKHKPNMMSGGEQQRVTIARAISNKPEILLLDEPTGDLDSLNSDTVIMLLSKLHEEGMTLVMVTHDEHLKNAANKVVFMRDGKVGNVEIVSKKKRDKFFSKLNTRLASYQSKFLEKEAFQAKKLQFSTKTERRTPLFYEYQSEIGQNAGIALLHELKANELNEKNNPKPKIEAKSEQIIQIDEKDDEKDKKTKSFLRFLSGKGKKKNKKKRKEKEKEKKKDEEEIELEENSSSSAVSCETVEKNDEEMIQEGIEKNQNEIIKHI